MIKQESLHEYIKDRLWEIEQSFLEIVESEHSPYDNEVREPILTELGRVHQLGDLANWSNSGDGLAFSRSVSGKIERWLEGGTDQ